MIRGIFLIALISLAFSGFTQSGGNNAYDFLNLTNSARVASLGGQQISIYDNDLNLAFHNPSTLNSSMDQNIVLNYVNYFAGVNYGYAAYAWQPKKPYTLAAGIHYINYGEFIEADANGAKMGTFKAADYAFNLFYSRSLIDSMLQIGVNVKPLYSDLESYTSLGLAIDVGITYYNHENLLSAALVVKNTGMQIKKYYSDQSREPLPFEIQLGITKELKHAPLRISLLAQQLQKPNLLYKTEDDIENEIDPFTGEKIEDDKFGLFGDNLLRHLILGVEFIPTKNFNVRMGYNYKRRQELKIEDKTAMVGFSWGFGVKISKFHISYGRSSYHLARGSNHFSVTMNLADFSPKL